MNQNNCRYTAWNTHFIARRADPYVLREGNEWYFTASVPEYDLRRADSLEGLLDAAAVVVWRAHECGDMRQHIWASELHFLDGKRYIYAGVQHGLPVFPVKMKNGGCFHEQGCIQRDP